MIGTVVEDSCVACVHFKTGDKIELIEKQSTQHVVGVCRRFPPLPEKNSWYGQFPKVQGDWKCGEFSLRSE